MTDVLTEEQEKALAGLRRRFGDDLISDNGHDPIEAISTGCPALDLALRIGGIPRGHVTEVYGPPGAGKSTFAMHVIAEAQKSGLNAALISGEPMLTADYLEAIGVDLDTLTVLRPGCLEGALESVEALVRADWGLIVMDSVAAFSPRAEVEGEVGDNFVGLIERTWDQGQRKIGLILPAHHTALVLVNQVREKVGVLLGDPRTTVAAEILEFWASLRIFLRRFQVLEKGGIVFGNKIRFQVKKNRLAAPFEQADLPLVFGRGFVPDGDEEMDEL
jgi:recombination protein RecA